jgi:small subunit ribosomal protein S9
MTTLQLKSKSKSANSFYATGKRKCSIARVWVSHGTGKITVNNKLAAEYFPTEAHVKNLLKPVEVTNTLGLIDVFATATGGGCTGQAEAIRLGIAKALKLMNADSNHVVLRKAGLLTRDSRIVERKKYGKRKARKSTQFSKR